MRSALAKYLPGQKKESTATQKFRSLDDDDLVSRHFKVPRSPFDWVVNDVCKICNEGWLNIQVEIPAEQFLARAMQGLPMPLTTKVCKAIALWAAKTAAIRALMDPPPRSIPSSHYSHMKEALEPPPNTAIWLARTEYCDKYFMRHTRLGTQDDFGRALTTSHFTSIVYGCMAIYIVGASHGEGLEIYEETTARIQERGAHQIWPVKEAPMWPVNQIPLKITRDLSRFVPNDSTANRHILLGLIGLMGD